MPQCASDRPRGCLAGRRQSPSRTVAAQSRRAVRCWRHKAVARPETFRLTLTPTSHWPSRPCANIGCRFATHVDHRGRGSSYRLRYASCPKASSCIAVATLVRILAEGVGKPAILPLLGHKPTKGCPTLGPAHEAIVDPRRKRSRAVITQDVIRAKWWQPQLSFLVVANHHC